MFPVIDKRETGINLRRIMDQRGITVKDVQQYLELGSVQSIYHWLNGSSMPTIDNLYALSELFQMPIDELVRGNRSAIVGAKVQGMKDTSVRRLYAYYTKFNKLCVA